MTRTALINRFKNHININVKNNAAYTDNALVDVLINRQRVDNEMFYLKRSTEILKIAQLILVFIEFVKSNSFLAMGTCFRVFSTLLYIYEHCSFMHNHLSLIIIKLNQQKFSHLLNFKHLYFILFCLICI